MPPARRCLPAIRCRGPLRRRGGVPWRSAKYDCGSGTVRDAVDVATPFRTRAAAYGTRARRLFFQVRADVVDRLLDRRDLFGVVIGNLGFEFLLERHHELHRVERIGAEVVDERGFVLDLRLVHAQLFGNDLLDALFDVFHALLPCEGSRIETGGFYQSRGFREPAVTCLLYTSDAAD